MAIYYFTVERGVYGLLNAFRSDNVADADTSYRSASLVADTQLQNAMYAPTQVRATILHVERQIASAICRIEGHARRVDFLKVVEKSHFDLLPSSVGGIGAVYLEGEGDEEDEYLDRRDADVVCRLRDSNSIVIAAPTYEPLHYYWGWDGSRFFTTAKEPVKIETFDPQTPEIDVFTDYDAPFVTASPVASKLADEFELAWACGAAGILASKVGTFPEEASGYLELFQALMAQQGVKVKIPLDFNSDE